MSHFAKDLRFAVRSLAKQPGLSILSILAFALGIGLTTTMFSIVDGALRDLPFERADRLMHLERNNLSQNVESMEVPIHDLLDWRAAQTSFEGLAGFYEGTINLSGDGERPERYEGGFMTANSFDLLGVTPALGRGFAAGEDQPGAQPVVVLGWNLWQVRFGGKADILGQEIRVNGRPRTVIGVMPEGFMFPLNQEIWTTLPHDPALLKRGEGEWLEVYGRLKDGVSLDQASADLARIATQIAEQNPETHKGVGSVIKPYTDEYIGKEPATLLYLMLGAVFGVLVIACANVANLLLSRAVMKSREVAVRSALGASRRRVIVQMVTEALLLASVGAVVGLGLAALGIGLFNRAIAPTSPPFWIDIGIDWTVLVFVAGITLLASVLAGLAPALQATGEKVNEILKDETRGTSSLRLGRLSRGLVVSEIAVSCVLLVLTGLMVKSVTQLKRTSFGVDKEHVFTARVALFEQDYPDLAARQRFFDEVGERLAALPGVTAAALADSLPVGGSSRERFQLDGKAYATEGDQPQARQAAVSAGFFDAVGARLVAGRAFNAGDRAETLPVAIVNQSFVRRFFPEEGPLGKRVGFEVEDETRWATVVGIAPDLYMAGNDNEDPEGFYLPLAQSDRSFISLVARTDGDPMALANPVRNLVTAIDPNQPLYFVRSLAESIRLETWFYGVFGTLFMVFGAVALFLAAVGLYGVMAFSVSRRTQEVGIRMALGAQAPQVLKLIFRQGAWQLAIGLGIGLAIAPLLSRFLRMALFQVSPWDPSIFALIALVLAGTGIAACMVPAQRAARVSPMVALRGE